MAGVCVTIVGNAPMSFRPRLPTVDARRNLAQPRGKGQIPRRCAARNDSLPTQMTLTHGGGRMTVWAGRKLVCERATGDEVGSA